MVNALFAVAPARRLPAVTFAAAPVGRDVLPRMDVAGMVGFASTGPVDVPVRVEDLNGFETVFGGKANLLRDAATGAAVPARLHPAVAAFFQGGGRTCWVVRVTKRGSDDQVASAAARPDFPLPGFVTTANTTAHTTANPTIAGVPAPATLRAAAVGSATDGVRLTAGVLADPVTLDDVLLGPADGGLAPVTARLVAGEVAACDLVRLVFPGLEMQVAVALVQGGILRGTASLLLAAPPDELVLSGTTDDGVAVTLDRDGVVVDFPLVAAPPPGGVLRCLLSDGRGLLVVVADAVALDAGRTRLTGSRRLVLDVVPAVSLAPLSAAVLTLELRARSGDRQAVVLSGLGLVPGHPRYLGDLPTDERLYADPDSVSAALADVARPRFPLAGPEVAGVLHPVDVALPTPPVGPVRDPRPALERDGLDVVGPELFLDPALLDPALLGAGPRAVAARAEYVRDTAERPRPLVGVHALLAVDEVTLVALPDGVQPGWVAVGPAPAPRSPGPEPYVQTRPCEHRAGPDTPAGAFTEADPDSLGPATIAPPDVDPLGTVGLRWGPAEPGSTSVVQESIDPDRWTGAREVHRGPADHVELPGRPPGDYAYRVRRTRGLASSDWSAGVACRVPGDAPWTLDAPVDPRPPGSVPPSPLADLHGHVLSACAARGDLFAVLATPEGFAPAQVAAHAAEVRGVIEDRTASFGAVHHPWLLDADSASLPPDGPVAGLLAAVAAGRGAWIAPANRVLPGVIAVDRPVADDVLPDQLAARVNPLLADPRGVLSRSAETLALDVDLGAIGVRRLLSLLRRIAGRYGDEFVFAPDDQLLRRAIRRRFEALLDLMLARGAFAGQGADAYRVDVTGGTDALLVEIRVAPSVPLRFLTVQLAIAGDGVTSVEGGLSR